MICFLPIAFFPVFTVMLTWTFSVKYTVMWSNASYLCDIYCSIGTFPHGTKYNLPVSEHSMLTWTKWKNNANDEWVMSFSSLPELREQLWPARRMTTDDFLFNNYSLTVWTNSLNTHSCNSVSTSTLADVFLQFLTLTLSILANPWPQIFWFTKKIKTSVVQFWLSLPVTSCLTSCSLLRRMDVWLELVRGSCCWINKINQLSQKNPNCAHLLPEVPHSENNQFNFKPEKPEYRTLTRSKTHVLFFYFCIFMLSDWRRPLLKVVAAQQSARQGTEVQTSRRRSSPYWRARPGRRHRKSRNSASCWTRAQRASRTWKIWWPWPTMSQRPGKKHSGTGPEKSEDSRISTTLGTEETQHAQMEPHH